jgi:uncharacterized protein (TIGR00369 family)
LRLISIEETQRSIGLWRPASSYISVALKFHIKPDGIRMTPQQQMMADNFQKYIPHAQDIGMRVIDISQGIAKLALDFRDELLGDPTRGLIHTGVITTLVDSACGFAVIANINKPIAIATLDLRMDYLRPAIRDKIIYVQAECYRTTRHIAFVRAKVWQDSEQRLIASCSSAFMLKPRKKPQSADTQA